MAADIQAGFIALNRFGLGSRRDGDLAAAASDPRGFLKAELARPGVALLDSPELPRTALALKIFYSDLEQKRLERLAAEMPAPVRVAEAVPPAPMDPSMQAGEAPAMQAEMPKPAFKPSPAADVQVFRAEASARLRRALSAGPGFVERLIAFWTNHFCVSTAKGGVVRICAGAFERDAIRPHVLGRFRDMLQAVESHPAMLFYLDNQISIGPNSAAGQRTGRGLNENLAREILELHTLGVNGGYTQSDVTALARIITGWTFAGRAGQLGEPGTFVFNANAHEPGEQIVLGRPYDQEDAGQGRAALADLAHHPATAQHVAFKLARHFVADHPSLALVDKLANTFRSTDGDLKALALALIDSPEAWVEERTKMRNPCEFLYAAGRIVGRMPDDPGPFLGGLNILGMPLWGPPGPNGFPDTAAAWANPEGMKVRLEICVRIAERWRDTLNPRDLLDEIAGVAASPETRQAIARAESKQEGLALLLMSPEVQRR
ncbi:MAG: hypothetical protein QOH65_479 [Methylobacteriaceae bacterium]|nr:hypothetical protein [Methylobacteriaceae bacterium]